MPLAWPAIYGGARLLLDADQTLAFGTITPRLCEVHSDPAQALTAVDESGVRWGIAAWLWR